MPFIDDNARFAARVNQYIRGGLSVPDAIKAAERNPMDYLHQPLTESQLYQLDNGEQTTGVSLREMERDPAISAELLRVRGTNTRERWAEIAHKTDAATDEERRLIGRVWSTMPGYTCFADAARLVARAY